MAPAFGRRDLPEGCGLSYNELLSITPGDRPLRFLSLFVCAVLLGLPAARIFADPPAAPVGADVAQTSPAPPGAGSEGAARSFGRSEIEELASLDSREKEAVDREAEGIALGRIAVDAATRQAHSASVQLAVIAAVAGMTLLGTVLLVRTLRQTAHLVNAARQSALDARQASRMAIQHFVSDRRPWLSVEAKALSGIRWDPEGGRLTLGVTVRNLGQLPATHVAVDFDAIVETAVVEGDKLAKLTRLMESARARAGGSHPDSFLLFPGQERDIPCDTVIRLKDIAEGSCDGDMFNPYLIGCVSYRFTGSDELHQTGFSYLPFKLSPAESASAPLRVSDGDLSPDMMGFAVDYEGGIAT